MKIVNKREKIIFTEKEAEAIVLVHKLMRDIEDDTNNDEVCSVACDIADYLTNFIENSFDEVDCVVCQNVADSTREIQISIAIK